MALGSTQPVTEQSIRNIPGGGGKGRPTRKADKLTTSCEPIVWKMWEPRRLTTVWVSAACYRNSFTFFTFTWLKRQDFIKPIYFTFVLNINVLL
jgi:hypothetical protein